MLRAEYPQSDGRAIARRKWRAWYKSGPLVYFAEHVQKGLIKFGYAATYEARGNGLHPSSVIFLNAIGQTEGFIEVLRLVVEVLARKFRVAVQLADDCLALDGNWSLEILYARKSRNPSTPRLIRFVRILDSSDELPF